MIKTLRGILEGFSNNEETEDNDEDHNHIDLKVLELVQKMKEQFVQRWGSGEDGTVWQEHKARGRRQIRKGIPRIVLLAAAVDPRFKRMPFLSQADREEVINVSLLIYIIYYFN